MIYFIFTPLAGHFWELTFQPSPHILPIVFRKMTFTIHLIFTSLAGIILRRFLTTFCSCFMFCLSSFSKRSLFFVLIPWYCIWCFMNFFVGIFFLASTATLCSSLFPKLTMVCHTLYMIWYLMFYELLEIIYDMYRNSVFMLQPKMFHQFSRS